MLRLSTEDVSGRGLINIFPNLYVFHTCPNTCMYGKYVCGFAQIW